MASKTKQAKEKAPEGQPNGVFVEVVAAENGVYSFNLTPSGDVKLTELPALLPLAGKAAERALGIG